MDDVRPSVRGRRRRRHPALAVALAAMCAATTLGCGAGPSALPAPPDSSAPAAAPAPATRPPVSASGPEPTRTTQPPVSASAPESTRTAQPPLSTAAAPTQTPQPPVSTQAPAATPSAGAPDTAGDAASARAAAALAANASAQLPGGGRTVFGGKQKMYVALYGHPSGGALGVLGEQGTAATIRRAKRFAAQYDPYTTRQVLPALEIIATIASASAGKDGDYSAETPVATLRPLVNAAKAAGVYVVLDLQPGRTDFLTQAKRYASLLAEPHVGLALDPEWRLKPKQKHLRQIGSVSAAEINRVSQWLADFTATARLPQKMLLLHQFKLSMIRNRQTLDTHHPQLAFVIQMDGQGSQPAKQDTWRALRLKAPPRVQFGWKNFVDEDAPMLTPRQTMRRVKPRPVWVSYQ